MTVPCRIFYSAEDDCWYVESPGFYDGIITDGDTLEDAKAMAQEAVEGLVATRLSYGQDCRIPRKTIGGKDWYDVSVDIAMQEPAEQEVATSVPHREMAFA